MKQCGQAALTAVRLILYASVSPQGSHCVTETGIGLFIDPKQPDIIQIRLGRSWVVLFRIWLPSNELQHSKEETTANRTILFFKDRLFTLLELLVLLKYNPKQTHRNGGFEDRATTVA